VGAGRAGGRAGGRGAAAVAAAAAACTTAFLLRLGWRPRRLLGPAAAAARWQHEPAAVCWAEGLTGSMCGEAPAALPASAPSGPPLAGCPLIALHRAFRPLQPAPRPLHAPAAPRSYVTGSAAALPRLGAISMAALPAGTQYAAQPADDVDPAATSGPAPAPPPLSHLSSAEGEFVSSCSPGQQGREEGGRGGSEERRPAKAPRV
jgi:hypothetical protein